MRRGGGRRRKIDRKGWGGRRRCGVGGEGDGWGGGQRDSRIRCL